MLLGKKSGMAEIIWFIDLNYHFFKFFIGIFKYKNSLIVLMFEVSERVNKAVDGLLKIIFLQKCVECGARGTLERKWINNPHYDQHMEVFQFLNQVSLLERTYGYVSSLSLAIPREIIIASKPKIALDTCNNCDYECMSVINYL